MLGACSTQQTAGGGNFEERDNPHEAALNLFGKMEGADAVWRHHMLVGLSPDSIL
jgi:hypothetical protein